jgi:hypothetical protein
MRKLCGSGLLPRSEEQAGDTQARGEDQHPYEKQLTGKCGEHDAPRVMTLAG